MLKASRPYCDWCGKELVRMTEDEAEAAGEPCGFPWSQAYEHYCNECYSEAIDRAFKEDGCPRCETQPCKRGRDCWFEPSLGIAYESYFADRLHASVTRR